MSLPRRLSKASEEVRSEFGLQRGRVVCQTLRRKGHSKPGAQPIQRDLIDILTLYSSQTQLLPDLPSPSA